MLKHPDHGQRLAQDISTWLKDQVAHYKLLRGGKFLACLSDIPGLTTLPPGIEFVALIPRSAAGKILRKELRARANADGKKSKAKL